MWSLKWVVFESAITSSRSTEPVWISWSLLRSLYCDVNFFTASWARESSHSSFDDLWFFFKISCSSSSDEYMNITALVRKAIQKASLLRLIIVLTTTTKITRLTKTLLSQFQMRMKLCSTPNNYLWKRSSSKCCCLDFPARTIRESGKTKLLA